MTKQSKTFWSDFKTFFVRGLIILLPSVLTLWLLVQAYWFVESNVAEPINSGIRRMVLEIAPSVVDDQNLPNWFTVDPSQVEAMRLERERQALPQLSRDRIEYSIRRRNLREVWDSYLPLRFIGLGVAIVLIYLAGLLLGGYIGRRMYTRLEEFFTRLPLFKQVYPHVKQVVDFLFGQNKKTTEGIQTVVLVEYPRKGIWTVGLLTGSSMREIRDEAGEDVVAIFIPSSPTPFTGYTITVPRKEVINMPITIDEALRFVVSGGVLVPETHGLPPVDEAALAKPPAASEKKASNGPSSGETGAPES